MVGRNVNVEKGKQGFQPRAPKAEPSKPMKIAVPEGPDTPTMRDQLLAKSIDDALISIDAALGAAHAGDKTTAKAVAMLTEDDRSWREYEQNIAEMVAIHPAASEETLRKLADDVRLSDRTKGRITARLNGVEAPDPIQTEGDRIISEESARAQRALSATREHIASQLGSGKRLSSSDYRNLMKHESRAAIWSEVEEIVAKRGITYTEAAARGRKMAMRKVLDSMPDQRSSNQLSNVMDDYQQSELLEFIRWTEDLDAYGTVG